MSHTLNTPYLHTACITQLHNLRTLPIYTHCDSEQRRPLNPPSQHPITPPPPFLTPYPPLSSLFIGVISAIGVNLKACNHFRLYNGKAAEAELKVLIDKGVNIQSNELIRHNMVVFSNGKMLLLPAPTNNISPQ